MLYKKIVPKKKPLIIYIQIFYFIVLSIEFKYLQLQRKENVKGARKIFIINDNTIFIKKRNSCTYVFK